MEKQFALNPVEPVVADPADDALLEVIQRNVQRVPHNDNATSLAKTTERLGTPSAIGQSVLFATLFLFGVFALMIYKLVPSTKDSHY